MVSLGLLLVVVVLRVMLLMGRRLVALCRLCHFARGVLVIDQTKLGSLVVMSL